MLSFFDVFIERSLFIGEILMSLSVNIALIECFFKTDFFDGGLILISIFLFTEFTFAYFFEYGLFLISVVKILDIFDKIYISFL
jgi:hypothetical protein